MDISSVSSPVIKKTYEYEFSICTLVTRKEEYAEMLQSFLDKGFDKTSCEYLFIDNTDTCTFEAYKGLNLFLDQAQGKYIIICHQDILLINDDRVDLIHKLNDLQNLDSNWAVCGNAGAAGPNYIIYHITYPDNSFLSKGRFPQKVQSVDENFVVVKNEAKISLSSDLTGFHLYGADICLQAKFKGYSSYVISFNLLHKSRGNSNSQEFKTCRKNLIKKYHALFKSRWIQTTSTAFYISGAVIPTGKNPMFLFVIRMLNGFKKRRKV